MKFIASTLIIIIGFLCSCQPPISYKIEFCNQFTEKDECNGTESVFPKNQRVFVKFSSNHALKDTLYIGQVSLKKTDGELEPLGVKEFRPDSASTYLKHYIPFDVFGGLGSYLVEFKNSKEEILAEKVLHFATEY